MKKMYNNPKTEAMELNGEAMMLGVAENSNGTIQEAPGGIEGAAPARKGNPLQGQIKL